MTALDYLVEQKVLCRQHASVIRERGAPVQTVLTNLRLRARRFAASRGLEVASPVCCNCGESGATDSILGRPISKAVKRKKPTNKEAESTAKG